MSIGSARRSPATEATLVSDGGSDGEPKAGSALLFRESAGPSGREADPAGSAEATVGECCGLPFLGSLASASAGGAEGLWGIGAGLAALAEGEACTDIVAGSAGVGAGLDTGV